MEDKGNVEKQLPKDDSHSKVSLYLCQQNDVNSLVQGWELKDLVLLQALYAHTGGADGAELSYTAFLQHARSFCC